MEQKNGAATASTILGIVSLVLAIIGGITFGVIGAAIALILGIVAVVLGINAKKQTGGTKGYTCYGCVGGSCLVSSDVNDAADSLNDLSNALNDLSDAYN